MTNLQLAILLFLIQVLRSTMILYLVLALKFLCRMTMTPLALIRNVSLKIVALISQMCARRPSPPRTPPYLQSLKMKLRKLARLMFRLLKHLLRFQERSFRKEFHVNYHIGLSSRCSCSCSVSPLSTPTYHYMEVVMCQKHSRSTIVIMLNWLLRLLGVTFSISASSSPVTSQVYGADYGYPWTSGS